MPDFSYNFRVEQPVEPVLVETFNDLLRPLQSALARISHEQSKLQEKCDALQRENDQLRISNQSLASEVSRLSALPPAPVVRDSAPPPKPDNASYVADAPGLAAPRSRGQPTAPPEDRSPFQRERTMKIHTAPVHCVTMGFADSIGTSDDMLATASWDGTVKLYSLAEDRVVRTLHEDGGHKMSGLYSVAFAKTAPEIIGCTSCDKHVYLWNHHTGSLLLKLPGHTDEINGIDFHSMQQVMCTVSDDCKAIIWDFQEGLMLRTLDKHTKAVYGATFLGGKDYQYFVATCSFDQKARVFDMRDKHVAAQLIQHTDDVIGIDYSPDTHTLATGSDDGLICLWDARMWKFRTSVNTREGPGRQENEVKRVAFSPGGGRLAAACSSGLILVYDVTADAPEQVAALDGHKECAFDVTWGHCRQSNARMLVSASHDHTCGCWREVV
mmetsp:Transcript_125694/g.391407  ORF Transcript_125694/g.391407 Transcript_125694/m.391407 type:complete len:440 (-) Transcript_125694:97-1416(-)